MSWLMARFYDRVMEATEEACLEAWRGHLLARARGRVLEIGSGTGANIAHYPADVSSVTFTEPDPHMRNRLEARLREQERPWDYRVLDVAAEELPADDDSFDTVVAMLVLCSVDDPDRAVGELRRVLRPDGQLLFIEHVAAEPGSSRHLVQRMVEPVWKLCAGNCHLTRTTEETLLRHGFVMDELVRESMRKAPSFVRPTVRGRAVPAQ